MQLSSADFIDQIDGPQELDETSLADRFKLNDCNICISQRTGISIDGLDSFLARSSIRLNGACTRLVAMAILVEIAIMIAIAIAVAVAILLDRHSR